jgi:hypothetical protein
MGTNYYVRTAGCKDDCGHCSESELVHLGKFSVGWKFSFRADPSWPRDEAIHSWLTLAKSGPIEDEYGDYQELGEFLAFVMGKQTGKYCHCVDNGFLVTGPFWDMFKDGQFHSGGFDFSDREFH